MTWDDDTSENLIPRVHHGSSFSLPEDFQCFFIEGTNTASKLFLGLDRENGFYLIDSAPSTDGKTKKFVRKTLPEINEHPEVRKRLSLENARSENPLDMVLACKQENQDTKNRELTAENSTYSIHILDTKQVSEEGLQTKPLATFHLDDKGNVQEDEEESSQKPKKKDDDWKFDPRTFDEKTWAIIGSCMGFLLVFGMYNIWRTFQVANEKTTPVSSAKDSGTAFVPPPVIAREAHGADESQDDFNKMRDDWYESVKIIQRHLELMQLAPRANILHARTSNTINAVFNKRSEKRTLTEYVSEMIENSEIRAFLHRQLTIIRCTMLLMINQDTFGTRGLIGDIAKDIIGLLFPRNAVLADALAQPFSKQILSIKFNELRDITGGTLIECMYCHKNMPEPSRKKWFQSLPQDFQTLFIDRMNRILQVTNVYVQHVLSTDGITRYITRAQNMIVERYQFSKEGVARIDLTEQDTPKFLKCYYECLFHMPCFQQEGKVIVPLKYLMLHTQKRTPLFPEFSEMQCVYETPDRTEQIFSSPSELLRAFPTEIPHHAISFVVPYESLYKVFPLA